MLYTQIDYSIGIKSVFIDAFKKLGGTIVADESGAQGSTDFRTQLTKVKNANPELIYSLAMQGETSVIIKQAKEVGITVPFFGADAWGDAKLWSGLGSAGEGDMYTTVATPLTATFIADMKAKTGGETTICSPEAYDSIKILAQVISKVGVDPTKIKNELYKTVYNGGVSADKISFDSNGDLVGANYSVYIVHNGVASVVK